MKKPKIIVIGAGYAGISFLKSLDPSCFKLGDFMIINKNSYHYHSTMLHKVATAEKSGKIMFDLREFLHHEIKIIQQCVIAIDDKFVTTEFSKFEYDYLVCAAGFEKETFNIQGIKNAMFIDSYKQSARICETIKLKFDEAVSENKKFDIAVCGGGLTGIEFAASAINMLKDKCKFRGISDENFSVHLISSTPRLLTFFSEKLSQKTANHLEKLGVKIKHNSRIVSIDKNCINLKDGTKFYSDLIIWTAGVKGSSLVSDGDIENERGRVKVDDKLCTIDNDKLFYIGDVSAVMDPKTNKPYPPTAQIAVEQGEFLAREFNAILNGKDFDEKFTFKSDGTICSIGHGYASALILGFEMSGFIPSLIKVMVEKKWNVKLLGLKGIWL